MQPGRLAQVPPNLMRGQNNESMTAKLFESALGISDPWFVASLAFDQAAKTLKKLIDFKTGTRFSVAGHEGAHPVHDTVAKTYRHLNFFQHECHLQVRTLLVKETLHNSPICVLGVSPG